MDIRALSEMNKKDIDCLMLKTVHVHRWNIKPEELVKLSNLPLDEIGLDSVKGGQLHRLMEMFPSLRRLSVSFHHLNSDGLKALASLEALKIVYAGERLSEVLPLTSIVSLHLINCPIEDPAPFSQLPKLKELKAQIRSNDVFNDAFWRVLRQLTRLDMGSEQRILSLPRSFWEMATCLEELSLGHLYVSSPFSDQGLSRLRKLVMWDCMVDGGCFSFDGLTSLTALNMKCSREPHVVSQCFMDPRPLR